jgi:tetratricopeptide (TPR) repeat protein
VDDSAVAEELHRTALEAVNAGRFGAARDALRRAARITTNPDLQARIALTTAYADAETGRSDEALSVCRTALGSAGISSETEGLLHSQIALLLMRRGDHVRSLEHFAAAIDHLQSSPDRLGYSYLNRGNVHLQRGDLEKAEADFESAAQHFHDADDEVGEAKATFNLAYVQLQAGDVVSALRGMDEAARVLSPLSTAYRATVDQDRAEVLLSAGRATEAADALESAARAYGAQRLRRFQAEAEFVLARTLLHEEPERARSVARRAARRFEQNHSATWAARAEALAVIADIGHRRHQPSVQERGDALTAQLRRVGQRNEAGQLALHLIRLSIHRGEIADATARLRKIRISDDTPIATRLLAHEVRAELLRAKSQRKRAADTVRAGLADLHSWQASFGSLDLQSTMVGHGNSLARLGLELALEDGRPAVVFEWSERARALASKVTTLRPPPDPDLAADLTALRMLDPDDTKAARELRERIRSKTWYAAEGSVGEPATLDALQTRLGEDRAALVAHIVLDDRLTALVVTGDSADVVALGDALAVRDQLDRIAADLDFAAHNTSGPFGETVRASLREDLSKVADELVTPFLDRIGERRVVLTPSALLAGTPWTMLPGLSGRPLTVPTSATRWLELVEQRAPKPKRIGLVAGPRVARASEEIDRAAAEGRSADVLHGDDANASKVGEVAARVDVLHLAGHGVHSGDHPLFSAVELADGPWFGHDIDLLPRTPSVVVLSACELGQVSVLRGEETVGMTAAWLHAGARTVLSSPALVADEVACEALAHWHRLVAAGSPPADALAEVVAASDGVVPFLCFGAGW